MTDFNLRTWTGSQLLAALMATIEEDMTTEDGRQSLAADADRIAAGIETARRLAAVELRNEVELAKKRQNLTVSPTSYSNQYVKSPVTIVWVIQHVLA